MGQRTAGIVRKCFGIEARQPKLSTARGMIELLSSLPDAPVLLVAGESRRPDLPRWLADRGSATLECLVYRTELVLNADLRDRFRDSPENWVLFSSPSTVRGFLISLDRSDLEGIRSNLGSIGPTTSEEIRALRGAVAREAVEPRPFALLRDLIRGLETT